VTQGQILSSHDDPPVEIVNAEGHSPIVLTCEHAGQLIPSRLGDLGLRHEEMRRHIAYDIGAQSVARLLSHRLAAPLLIQRYSRLVVDCNRPFSCASLVPSISDGTPIPANQAITPQERQARYDEIHQPFHRAVAQMISNRTQAGLPVILVAVHSFTRMLRTTGEVRTLSLGLLFNRDRRLADALMNAMQQSFPDIKLACNEPYSISDEGDYTIPVHGEAHNIPHILLEIINDEIADASGQERWCTILASALQRACHEILGNRSAN